MPILIYAVFALYIAFLLKLLLLSRVSLSDLWNGLGAADRAMNLIPFRSYWVCVLGSSDAIRRFAFSNVAGDILAFISLGADLTLIGRDKRIARNLLWVFVASLLVEPIQGLFAIGTADVDDVILNCLGGLIGIWGNRFIAALLRNEDRAHTAIAILSAMGLPVLLYYLFVVKLRL